MSVRSGHLDTFTQDNLPPRDLQPDFVFSLPSLRYPARLNAVTELLDAWLLRGHSHAPCLLSEGTSWSYRETAERVNRIANVLTQQLGLKPGGRVLLRSANTPMLVAAYLAVVKAGGVVVATMPLLRAKELTHIIAKAKVSLALCDARLLGELEIAQAQGQHVERIIRWGDGGDASLEALMAAASPDHASCDTAAEDICLIGFTSGTTGEPKGTMHNHRDLLATCDSYGAHVLKARADDVFIGSPPLAFTFGLGGLVLFPLRVGASTVLLDKPSPDEMLAAIAREKATVCFTAPTAYRAMLGKLERADLSSLRICVSAGEALPKATFEAWQKATGLKLMDGIGATEMLHIFIAAPADRIRPGSTGLVVPGYEAHIIDQAGHTLPRGEAGRLAVRGPTGCRYLADARQSRYVERGWNITGDTYIQDADGYFWYQARSDDMIVSAGYNIAGPEVEAALLSHAAVAECAVVGLADEERGMIVKAFIVTAPGHKADEALAKALQEHVKAEIAPYKYPRAISFVESLPKTQTGKLQRFALRELASETPAHASSTKGPVALLPEGWPRPRGYSNGMMAQGRFVLTGGVVGWDEKERFAEGFVPQVAQTLRNIVAILKAGDAGPQHLMRLTWYVTDIDAYTGSLREIGKAYREIIGPHYPAMALVQVVRLVEPKAMVEIEATAVVPG